MDVLIQESLSLRDELLEATRSLEEFAQQLADDATRILEEDEAHEQPDTGGER